MTQVGESVAIIPPGGKEKCIFCGKDHQKEKAAEKASFDRNMSTLKKEGREYTKSNYASFYPGLKMAPLVEWQSDIIKTGGYKAAAHHCIALKCLKDNDLSGELKAANYDPNRGSNCCWLPYSKPQFSRARAYRKPMQKHRGGHTDAYFKKVTAHLEAISARMEQKFCANDKSPSKEKLLSFMESEEKKIWHGLATPSMEAYHLYNQSYLDPKMPWGKYPYEEGKDRSVVIGTATPADDDTKAQEESENDPE